MRCASGIFLLCLLPGCATIVPQPDSATATAAVTQQQEADAAATPPGVAADFAAALEVMRAGEWQAARVLMQEVADQAPGLASPQANLGIILEHLEQLEEAEQAYLQALSLQPEWAALHNRVGLFYRRSGRFDEALGQYRQALSLQPELAAAHLNLAVLYEIYLGRLTRRLSHGQATMAGEEMRRA